MKKLILLSLFISSFIISQAQTPPVNDACSGAIDLGLLPEDEGCGGNGPNAGTGAATGSLTATGTNVDATAIEVMVMKLSLLSKSQLEKHIGCKYPVGT